MVKYDTVEHLAALETHNAILIECGALHGHLKCIIISRKVFSKWYSNAAEFWFSKFVWTAVLKRLSYSIIRL